MQAEKILYEMDFSESLFIRDTAKRKFHVENIALLGEMSKHGYRYLRDAMRRAVSMYEGVKVFINHPSTEETKLRQRDVRNLAGKMVNARFDASVGKVRGDFVGLPNEEGKRFVDIAELMPEVAGMSQHAMGKFGKINGERVVEEITAIYSVDLVSSPATTAGLFENESFKDTAGAEQQPTLRKASAAVINSQVVLRHGASAGNQAEVSLRKQER